MQNFDYMRVKFTNYPCYCYESAISLALDVCALASKVRLREELDPIKIYLINTLSAMLPSLSKSADGYALCTHFNEFLDPRNANKRQQKLLRKQNKKYIFLFL